MNVKHLLLSASLAALIISPAHATKQKAVELADLESNEQALIDKLKKSSCYTIDLDPEQKAEGIKNAVIALSINNDEYQKPSPSELSEIKFAAQHRIVNNLEKAKDANLAIVASYRTTRNVHNQLSVISDGNPLVYPIIQQWRDRADSFLPQHYRGSFMSQPLWEEIAYYAAHNGLSTEDAQRLNKYISPIFYITQVEVMKMLEGNQSLLHTKRWVYSKDRRDVVKAIQRQTAHHHALIKNANLKGLNPNVVEHNLVPTLVDLALSLIPKPYTLLKAGKNLYTLGINARHELSLIHPDNGLPYPVFPSVRGGGDMNLPFGYRNDQFLRNQWQRVDDYVRSDYRIDQAYMNRMKVLLEPIGYLFRQAIQNVHISNREYPVKQEAEDRLIDLTATFVKNRTLPADVLTTFYEGKVNLSTLIEDLKRQGATHLAMTDDLIPTSISVHSKDVIDNLVEYLTLKDMVDRFKHFYPYDDSKLDVMSRTLK